MIQANELRIGNFIMYSDIKKVFDVGLWLFSELDARISFINDFEPIPLTEEWLLKFGFELHQKHINFTIYYDKEFNYRIEFYHESGEFWFDELMQIKFVHSLQNIYFALTGNELELK